jgi:hypothetical protein
MKYLKAFAPKQVVLVCIFFFLSASFSVVFAQGDTGDDPDIPTIPIDGGLSLLLVAGAAYGGKKVHEFRNRKSKKAEEQQEL